jgi:hypothetical protein
VVHARSHSPTHMFLQTTWLYILAQYDTRVWLVLNHLPGRATLLHMATIHCDDRQYQCGTCTRKCTLQCTLTAHMATHCDERQHTCGTCGTWSQTFTTKSNLSAHMAVYTVVRDIHALLAWTHFPGRIILLCTWLQFTTIWHKCGICTIIFTQKNSYYYGYSTRYLSMHMSVI